MDTHKVRVWQLSCFILSVVNKAVVSLSCVQNNVSSLLLKCDHERLKQKVMGKLSCAFVYSIANTLVSGSVIIVLQA